MDETPESEISATTASEGTPFTVSDTTPFTHTDETPESETSTTTASEGTPFTVSDTTPFTQTEKTIESETSATTASEGTPFTVSDTTQSNRFTGSEETSSTLTESTLITGSATTLTTANDDSTWSKKTSTAAIESTTTENRGTTGSEGTSTAAKETTSATESNITSPAGTERTTKTEIVQPSSTVSGNISTTETDASTRNTTTISAPNKTSQASSNTVRTTEEKTTGSISTTAKTTSDSSSTTSTNGNTTDFRTTNTFSTATTPGLPSPCRNGGTFDGIKCICLNEFYGLFCEFIINDIVLDTMPAAVEVTVKILDKELTDSLRDSTSQDYKAFVKLFEGQMKLLYDNIEGYLGVEVLKLSRGSIIVDHKVIVKAPNSNSAEDALKKIQTILNGTSCTSTSLDHFCFQLLSANSSNVTIEEVCMYGNLIPEEYRMFYYGVISFGKPTCISNCSNINEHRITCNTGQCSVRKNGPMCFCEFSDTYWYTGDRCQVAIHKVGVYVGVSLGLAVLLALIIGLAIFLVRNKKPDRQKLLDTEEKWYEDVCETSSGGGLTIRNLGLVNWDGASGSASGSEHFRPSLDKVDTKRQLKIARPEVTAF